MTQQPDKQPKASTPKEGAAPGEGDYVAGRRFRDAERSFAGKDSSAPRKAREAADRPEADDLDGVRRTTGEGRIRPQRSADQAGDGSDPHTEENLDKGLEETFPASDPVSISPGAD